MTLDPQPHLGRMLDDLREERGVLLLKTAHIGDGRLRMVSHLLRLLARKREHEGVDFAYLVAVSAQPGRWHIRCHGAPLPRAIAARLETEGHEWTECIPWQERKFLL